MSMEPTLTRDEISAMRNSYPLYMFDSDARCKCGMYLTYHRDFLFCNRLTGHREAKCPECNVWMKYDTAPPSAWATVKKTWQRGVQLER